MTQNVKIAIVAAMWVVLFLAAIVFHLKTIIILQPVLLVVALVFLFLTSKSIILKIPKMPVDKNDKNN